MLKKQIEKYLKDNKADGKLPLFTEESNILVELGLVTADDIHIVENIERFPDLYLELANKETDELVIEEVQQTFLKEKINYLENHMEQYLSIESSAFDIISAESFIMEVDSVFETYELLLGLQLPKKAEKNIRLFIEEHLEGDKVRYNLMFNGQDGLWEVNLPLEKIEGFHKDMTIAEAIKLAYLFLFDVSKSLEK